MAADTKRAGSINNFCEDHGFCRSSYYNLDPKDRPDELRIGGRVLITEEAAAEWRRRMTARTRRLATALAGIILGMGMAAVYITVA